MKPKDQQPVNAAAADKLIPFRAPPALHDLLKAAKIATGGRVSVSRIIRSGAGELARRILKQAKKGETDWEEFL